MMISGPLLKTHSEAKKESKSSSKQYLYLKKWRKKPENYVRTLGIGPTTAIDSPVPMARLMLSSTGLAGS